MFRTTIVGLVLALVLSAAPCASAKPLTEKGLAAMAEAGFDDAEILAKAGRKNNFYNSLCRCFSEQLKSLWNCCGIRDYPEKCRKLICKGYFFALPKKVKPHHGHE